MSKSAFPEITSSPFEGPSSKNPLSFKHYNAAETVEGRPMKDWLRFSVAYWHTFRNSLSDPFGAGTAIRPWDNGTDSVESAKNRARNAFEFIQKLGAPYYAFLTGMWLPKEKPLLRATKISMPLSPS